MSDDRLGGEPGAAWWQQNLLELSLTLVYLTPSKWTIKVDPIGVVGKRHFITSVLLSIPCMSSYSPKNNAASSVSIRALLRFPR